MDLLRKDAVLDLVREWRLSSVDKTEIRAIDKLITLIEQMEPIRFIGASKAAELLGVTPQLTNYYASSGRLHPLSVEDARGRFFDEKEVLELARQLDTDHTELPEDESAAVQFPIARNEYGRVVYVDEAKPRGKYHCLICNKPIVARRGRMRTPNFFHKEGSDGCRITRKDLIWVSAELLADNIYKAGVTQTPFIVEKTDLSGTTTLEDWSERRYEAGIEESAKNGLVYIAGGGGEEVDIVIVVSKEPMSEDYADALHRRYDAEVLNTLIGDQDLPHIAVMFRRGFKAVQLA